MRVVIDADGCPVVRIAVACAQKYGIPVTLVCDFAHIFDLPGTEVITVEKGADSADYRIVNLVQPGDVIITQDYGLAAMGLARKATVISQNGLVYTDENIDSLLMARHTSRKLRNAGVRLKGPSKRTTEQNEHFLRIFEAIIRK